MNAEKVNKLKTVRFERVCEDSKSLVGYGWMDGWMDGWMEGWMDGWMDGWIDGGMGGDGWMEEWMDGWMDGWTKKSYM